MIDHIQLISVGDMIEAINGQSLLGCRHYEVARLLKELPRGRTFTLKLTEPRKAFGEGASTSTSVEALVAWVRATVAGRHQQVAPKASQLQWSRGIAPPCPGEGVLALRPAWEEGENKEEVAPTPSFPEPLAQPSAPSPGKLPPQP